MMEDSYAKKQFISFMVGMRRNRRGQGALATEVKKSLVGVR